MSRLYLRSRHAADSGGSANADLQLTFQMGSSFFESDRAAREGNIGPSLLPLIIGVPSTGAAGDRAFVFRQLDVDGTPIGPDTSSLYPALAGFTVTNVDLAFGVLDEAAVAETFRLVAAGLYTSATRVDEVVTIADAGIDAATSFLPSSTSGGGAMLGTLDIQGPNDFAQDNTNVITLVTPAFADTEYLWSIQLKVAGVYAEQLRLGLYVDGAQNAPAGSTLLYDFGMTPASAVIDGYLTLYCNELIEVPASTRIQAVIIGVAAATTEINYQNAAGAGDWEVSPGGLFQATAALGVDPSVALPAVFPAGGSNVSGTFTANLRFSYRSDPLYANGQMGETEYGVHVDATALVSRSAFLANVFTGGNLPPQIPGIGLAAMSMAAEDDASFRYGVLQGGIVENPDGSDTIYDFGRGPVGPGLATDWYQLTVPPGTHVPIDIAEVIWAVARNEGDATIAFFFGNGGPGPGAAGPQTNPMDWPQNDSAPAAGDRPEYETFATNLSFSIDPDVAFEATFTRNAVTDNEPGNVPGSRLRFRTRPVLLAAV